MPDTFTLAALPPTVTVTALMVPTVVGARLDCFTVTAMFCVAVKPLGSRAVTVTVADPTATGVIVTVALDTLTVALAVSDDTAV